MSDSQRNVSGSHSKMLVSDKERESVVAALSDATKQGRLTADELEDRVKHALQSRQYNQLNDALDQLPVAAVVPSAIPSPQVVDDIPDSDLERPLSDAEALGVLLFAIGLIVGVVALFGAVVHFQDQSTSKQATQSITAVYNKAHQAFAAHPSSNFSALELARTIQQANPELHIGELTPDQLGNDGVAGISRKGNQYTFSYRKGYSTEIIVATKTEMVAGAKPTVEHRAHPRMTQ